MKWKWRERREKEKKGTEKPNLIFGGVLERHPALRFCFVHGGGFAPYQIGRR